MTITGVNSRTLWQWLAPTALLPQDLAKLSQSAQPRRCLWTAEGAGAALC